VPGACSMLLTPREPSISITQAQTLQGQSSGEEESPISSARSQPLSSRKGSFKAYNVGDFLGAGLVPQRPHEASARRPTVHTLIDFEACNQVSGQSSSEPFDATDSESEVEMVEDVFDSHSWEEMPDEQVWKHISLAERTKHSQAAADLLAKRLERELCHSFLMAWRIAVQTKQMQERIASLECENAHLKFQVEYLSPRSQMSPPGPSPRNSCGGTSITKALLSRRDMQESCPELVPEVSPELVPESVVEANSEEHRHEDVATDALQIHRSLPYRPIVPPYVAAVALNGFLVFWTGSMFALRAPRMAFCSLPFWVESVQLLHRTMGTRKAQVEADRRQCLKQLTSGSREDADRDETESLHSFLHQAEEDYTAITQVMDTESLAPEVSTEGEA